MPGFYIFEECLVASHYFNHNHTHQLNYQPKHVERHMEGKERICYRALASPLDNQDYFLNYRLLSF